MKLSCCGNIYLSNGANYEKVSRYLTDRKNFIKPYSNGHRTKSETIYVAVCENKKCGHYIVTLIREFDKVVEPEVEKYKGIAGDNFFYSNYSKFKEYPLPCPFADIKHKKTVPYIYGKVINANTQVPRYIDESDNAGNIIENPIKVFKCSPKT